MKMKMMMMLPVFVDEGVEGHAVSPAGAEVVDVHVWIPDDKQRTHLLLANRCSSDPTDDLHLNYLNKTKTTRVRIIRRRRGKKRLKRKRS